MLVRINYDTENKEHYCKKRISGYEDNSLFGFVRKRLFISI